MTVASKAESLMPVWWTVDHDIKLLRLLCKHGFGNYLNMFKDTTPELHVSTMPVSFDISTCPPKGIMDYTNHHSFIHSILILYLLSLLQFATNYSILSAIYAI